MDTILKNSIVLSSHNTLVDKQINGNLIFGVIDFLILICIFCKIPVCIEIDIKNEIKKGNNIDYIIGHCDKFKYKKMTLKKENVKKKIKYLNKYFKLTSKQKKSVKVKDKSNNINNILFQCIQGKKTLSFILKYITKKYKLISKNINKSEFIPPIILSFDINTHFLKENKKIVYDRNFINILKKNIDKKFLVLGNCEDKPLSKLSKKILLRFQSNNNAKKDLPNIRNIVKTMNNSNVSSKSYIKNMPINNLLKGMSVKSLNRIYPKIKTFSFNIDKLNKISDKNSHNMILRILLNKKYTKKSNIINMIAINFNNINYKNKYISSSYILNKILLIFFTYYNTNKNNIAKLQNYLTDVDNKNNINIFFIYDFVKTLSPNYKFNARFKKKYNNLKKTVDNIIPNKKLDNQFTNYYDYIDHTIINNLIHNE